MWKNIRLFLKSKIRNCSIKNKEKKVFHWLTRSSNFFYCKIFSKCHVMSNPDFLTKTSWSPHLLFHCLDAITESNRHWKLITNIPVISISLSLRTPEGQIKMKRRARFGPWSSHIWCGRISWFNLSHQNIRGQANTWYLDFYRCDKQLSDINYFDTYLRTSF